MQYRGWSLLALFSAVAVLTILFSWSSVGRTTEAQDNYMSGYLGTDAEQVGSDTCIMCHSDRTPGSMLSHVTLLDGNPDGEWYGFGCEGCHGPGGNHMGNPAGIINPPSLSSDGLTDLCSKCHSDLRTYNKEEWFLSGHYSSDVTCLGCHSGHSENDNFLVNETELDLCYTCHSEKRAEFSMRSHHPVEEGQLACSSCHNPHSGTYENQLVAEGDELCFGCHADKEGPFVYGHDVSMASGGDGCLTCHLSHGGNFDKMLRIPSNQLCLECHTEMGPENHFPETCWTSGCHSEIHGSNSHPLYFF
jgi:DmsE family decaheme c-type cytochrome